MKLARLLVLLACMLPAAVNAWWNDAWPYRMGITVDSSLTGANLTETNNNVPVLLKLHTGNFEDFFLLSDGAKDLRFVAADDKTPLKHHIEHFDLINQFLFVWVSLPELTAGIATDRIWMYYGNAEAVANEDPAGTFDVDTVLAYHFSSSQPVPQDSTAYGAHASSFTGSLNNSSAIASGAIFEAANNLIINDLPSLSILPGKGVTVSFWLKPSVSNQPSVIFEKATGASSFSLKTQGNNIQLSIKMPSGAIFETSPVAALVADTWQHIAVVLEDSKASLYVGGAAVSFTGIALEPLSGSWVFGSDQIGARGFAGEIDELKISTVVRNASWIKAAVASQGLASNLLQPQSAEQLGAGSGGGGLWFVMFKNTEESGWTVIILLGFMALFSWFVMIGKFIYMQAVGKDNAGFLKEYEKIKFKNPALLDHEDTDDDKALSDSPIMQAMFGKHDHFQSSPIYRLYHKGIHEVQDRLGASVNLESGKAGINEQAVEAIKAAVDAQIIREIQRLNSKMVMLTIAISGGPFLGLLGTVLGVMITFASIALTGDVNISAIAPGVAAALLTTVAGLVVAIPALFGYNYLTIGIKEAIADMRVFADEFVTRLAEYYREVPVEKKVSYRSSV